MNRPSQLRRFLWRHPEWWSLGLSLVAWLLLLLPLTGSRFTLVPHHHHAAARMSALWAGEVLWWIVMMVAMMWPLIIDRMRVTAGRSLWARRNWAVAIFLLGYVGPWMFGGLVVAALVVLLRARGWMSPAALLIVFALAAIWQLTPGKERALRLCHRTIPLAPEGLQANRDCLRYGWMIGASCLLSCGVLMAACAASGHNMAAMVGSGSIGFVERYAVRPKQGLLSSAIAGLAIVCTLSLPH